MNKELKKIGDIKLEDYLKGWIDVDTASPTIEDNMVEDNNQLSGKATGELVIVIFKVYNIKTKYNEILDFIAKNKQLEFKGDNIEDEFSKFFELNKQIKEKESVITEMLTKLKNIQMSAIAKEDVTTPELLLIKDVFNRIQKSDQFWPYVLSATLKSVDILIDTIKYLQEFSQLLQYNLLNMYINHKDQYIFTQNLKNKIEKDQDILTQNLDKKKDQIKPKTIKQDSNIIFTVFSKASNFDIDKESYYDRREKVQKITTIIQAKNKDENSLIQKLNKKEFNNNYTINYKNIYVDPKCYDFLTLNPLVNYTYWLEDIKTKIDLTPLISIFNNSDELYKTDGIYNSIDKLMSSGFNRIVLVENDIVLFSTPDNRTIAQLKQNKYEGKDLSEGLFDLYKENIEYIKYVSPWSQAYRKGQNLEVKSLHYEMISHLAKFRSKSEKINELKKFNKQQLYVENTFCLERITLNNLVEKLRFLLFADLKRDYINTKNNDILNYYKEWFDLRYNGVGNPLSDLKIYDENLETKKIDEFRKTWDSSSEKETKKFLNQNLIDVNNYLSHSLFIFIRCNWEDVSKKFLENRITLSSGMNTKKKYLDIISYKLSVLFYNLYGDKGYKLVSQSFNKKTTKSESKKITDTKILDAKGFGQINRFGDVCLPSSNSNANEINNVYNSLLNFKSETKFGLDYLLNQEPYILEQIKQSKNRRIGIDSNKRFYSSYNLNKENHNNINYKNENSLVNSKEIISLCDQFLKESSYYFSELNEIIVDGLDKKISLQSLQTNIENYAVKREMEISYEKLFHDKDVGEFSPIITTLKKSLIELEVCLINFTSNYYINNYKNLIQGMRLGNKNVNFYLLLFVVEAEIDRIQKVRLSGIKAKTDYSEQYKDILIKRVEKIKTIIGIIIFIIAKFVLKYNSEDDIDSMWGTITQSNLINKIGYEFINRIPVDFPDNFFEGMDDMPDEDKDYIRKYYSNEFNLVKNTIEFKGEVGSTILDLIMNPNNNLNLLTINKIVTKDKKTNIYISISKTYIELLSKKIYTPYKLPMVIKPKKWNKNQKDGGFLTNDFNKFANISLLHKSYKTSSTSEMSDIQIDTINFLNQQKLKINTEILYLLVKEYYNKDSILYNGLNKLHIESKENKTYNKDYSKKVLSHNSKYMLYNQVLSVAILLKNFSFYQTTFYDFRGRIYTDSDYFSYQSEDMSKSLIEFEEGCILDDSNIKYVLQYLANLGGNSKLTIKNKENWSINLINNLNITKDKLDSKNFRIKDVSFKEDFLSIFNIEYLIQNGLIKDIILNNKDKLQFIVLLFNLIECLINNNKLFCTPISFDATCNGFQHIAAIFKDIKIAKISNVINDSAKPNDVYDFVAKNVIKLIETAKDRDLKDKFLLIKFNRNLLKKPVMTIPYNVGLDKLKNQLINDEHNFFELKKRKESLKDKKNNFYFIVNKAICKNNESLNLSPREFGHLTSLLYKGVYSSFPKLTKYVQYTKKIADIFSALNLPIEWITPAGMKVKMGYQKRESKPIKSLFSKLRIGSVSRPLTKLDSISNRIAFMPNLIHSMDATNIQLLIKIFTDKNKTMNLLTTHDCFATTPNYMYDLNKEIRLAFLMIYFKDDYIKSVHENFIKQIYNTTKLIYIKEKDKLVKVNIEDIKNITLSLDCNKEYVIIMNKKKYTIPSLPYNSKKLQKIKQNFERIVSSLYFIN